ncbi:DUF6279 family lipoprotein [Vibrio sp. ZSDE26]|uniref:DUF6279 family lipoprotein n=1 Tax=Vibrio amylolyticus TaxID=2847292 RepID=A0A9X1XLA8_9VIBR|nr:DUF6279 family lipoprotein [Vibrio amylolyticus]MCK6264285.1 DUF6279 family lipoprotein [Vibrio amylolyticus]
MRVIIVALVCVLLASCGTKFAYRNMDWFILEYVDDFVDLTSDQDDILTLQIEQLSDWHRAEELPLYVQHLDSLLSLAPQTLTQEDIAAHFKQIELHSERLLNRVAPDLYALTQTLTDEQVEQLLESIAERHQEYRDKYKELSDEEIHERYQERIGDKVETWIGRLSKEQKQIVEQWGDRFMISAYEWMAYQTTMHNEWQTVLERRDDLSYFQPNFQRLLFESDRLFTPELIEMIEHNRSVSEEHIVMIAKSMSDKQWKHFKKEVNKWKSVAEDLQQ